VRVSIDFKFRDFCYPWSILRLRAQFQRSQWFSQEEFIRYQGQRLHQVVAHAYENVPYYRDLFQRLRLTPADVRTPADLPKIPMLSKTALRENFPLLRATTKERFRPLEVWTSGTSGEPTRVLMDKPANVLEFVYYWRHWGWAGYRLGDRFAELSSHFFLREESRARSFAHRHRLSGRLLLNSLALSPEAVPVFAREMREHRSLFLKGIASALYYFALFFREQGVSDIALKAIFSTGEALLAWQRRMIENVFHCKVYDSYGHMERTVAISECPEGGLHINPEYGILELVKREPLKRPPGAVGKAYTAAVVGTSLHNFSMPLLRYEVGDVVEVEEPDLECACGRAMPRVRRIIGRQEDAIVAPDGRVVTTLFIVFEEIPGVVQGQIIQEAVDRLQVRVVRGSGYTAESEGQLFRYLRRFVGPDMAIDLAYFSQDAFRRKVGDGKFRTVISRLGNVVASTSGAAQPADTGSARETATADHPGRPIRTP
jgi:phenylacetate-CoA ligase